MSSEYTRVEQLEPPPAWLVNLVNGQSQQVESQAEAQDEVGEGERNRFLFTEGCRLRRLGSGEADILRELASINRDRCVPPLDERELKGIVRSASNFPVLEETGQTSKSYSSLDEFLQDDMPETKEVILGLCPGEVGMLVSVTNVGKTTLMLNMALALAAGECFPPLVPAGTDALRVLYCDFETRPFQFRKYLETMLDNLSNQSSAKSNFIPVVDHVINDEPLNLSNAQHRTFLKERAIACKANLIILDTMGAAFELADENSNSEVTRALMKPLKILAKETNTAVLLCHHSGKPSESSPTEKAYAGRGASAMGALSRAVFHLARDKKKGEDYVTLECAKVKGRRFEPVLLQRESDKAWFRLCDEKPELQSPITVEEVREFVRAKGTVKRKDILEHFKDRASEETIDRRLDDGVKIGALLKPKNGVYSPKP